MTDYCEAPDEVLKNPGVKDRITLAANGDPHAADFLWRFWNFSHAFDDLIDQDKPITAEKAMRELLLFVQMLSFNPFYQRHKDQLYSLLVQIGATVVDCDDWLAASKDTETRRIARAIGPGDCELIFHVAFLTGGWDHMRNLKGLRSCENFQRED